MKRRMVHCVHTVLPDERNHDAVMILAVGYLLVNQIIRSDKQRACAKATYQPPVKNSRAWNDYEPPSVLTPILQVMYTILTVEPTEYLESKIKDAITFL